MGSQFRSKLGNDFSTNTSRKFLACTQPAASSTLAVAGQGEKNWAWTWQWYVCFLVYTLCVCVCKTICLYVICIKHIYNYIKRKYIRVCQCMRACVCLCVNMCVCEHVIYIYVCVLYTYIFINTYTSTYILTWHTYARMYILWNMMRYQWWHTHKIIVLYKYHIINKKYQQPQSHRMPSLLCAWSSGQTLFNSNAAMQQCSRRVTVARSIGFSWIFCDFPFHG